MSELPITHCAHGIDRAYRCIDCIEAERDALRAWAQELEAENLALQNVLSSIAALAEEWERVAARAPEQVYVTAWQETLAECATKLRQLVEGNSAAAQEQGKPTSAACSRCHNVEGDCDALVSNDPTACPCRCHESEEGARR